MKHSTNLVIISGPSGAGEDSVIEELIKRGLPIERPVSTVARPKRAGESEGKPYHFVTKKEFDDLIKQNKMAEWAIVYNSQVGITKQELERVKNMKNKIGIWKIDWKGVISAKKMIPDILAIFVTAESIDELIKRLKKRGDSEKIIKSRVDYTRKYYKNKNVYDYEVINKQGKLEKTVDEIIGILKKESFIS